MDENSYTMETECMEHPHSEADMKKTYESPVLEMITLNPEETLDTTCLNQDVMMMRRIVGGVEYKTDVSTARRDYQLVISKDAASRAHSFKFYKSSSNGTTGGN